jgi:hypothetical protein
VYIDEAEVETTFPFRIAVGTLVLSLAAASGLSAQRAASGAGQYKLQIRRWAKASPNHENSVATANLAMSSSSANATNTVPLWTYFTESPRDGMAYTGVIVGRNPLTGGGSANVPTYVVPIAINTSQIGTSVDPQTGAISTSAGNTTFDPTVADRSCLSGPNNVPVNLVLQSPVLQSATFDFGGTVVGTTQYVDAFQRANFWKAVGDDANDYHVLLGPVKTLPAITLNVPAVNGLALSTSALGISGCSPLGIIDVVWFDKYLDSTLLPALAKRGVNASNLPTFLLHNVVMAYPVTNLNTCCILGYHSTTATVPIQTYAAFNFDSTGLFSPAYEDTSTMSHEIAEWMNDPFGDNATPAWGNTGQVQGCQSNLEVADPLSGTSAPPIVMPNGFTYHLQELAFFSWFYGSPSTAIHGWFSDNGTFLSDAGAVCTSQQQ